MYHSSIDRVIISTICDVKYLRTCRLVTALVTVVLTMLATSFVVATPLVVDLAVPSVLLPNVPCLIDTVTVSVAADVVIKLPSPATLKDKPPFLLSACPVVDVLLSPVNVKVFAPRVLTAVEELVTALLIAVLTAFLHHLL